MNRKLYNGIGLSIIAAILAAPFPFNYIAMPALLAWGMFEGNLVR